jgi:hypothetical protein
MPYDNTPRPITNAVLAAPQGITYKPEFARACGGAVCGLLVRQMLFWQLSKSVAQQSGDGWWWWTEAEIERQTALTRCEQETARRRLKERSILEERRGGERNRLYFRLNWEALERSLVDSGIASPGSVCGNPAHCIQSALPASPVCGNPAVQSAENPHTLLKEDDHKEESRRIARAPLSQLNDSNAMPAGSASSSSPTPNQAADGNLALSLTEEDIPCPWSNDDSAAPGPKALAEEIVLPALDADRRIALDLSAELRGRGLTGSQVYQALSQTPPDRIRPNIRLYELLRQTDNPEKRPGPGWLYTAILNDYAAEREDARPEHAQERDRAAANRVVNAPPDFSTRAPGEPRVVAIDNHGRPIEAPSSAPDPAAAEAARQAAMAKIRQLAGHRSIPPAPGDRHGS